MNWVKNLSSYDYKDDAILIAGDISGKLDLFVLAIKTLTERFSTVMFVPGNHDLWVDSIVLYKNSLEKHKALKRTLYELGVTLNSFTNSKFTIYPILSWYDYSFGQPTADLIMMWADYYNCVWPRELSSAQDLSDYFLRCNEFPFLPRIDLMPSYIPIYHQILYPILGSTRIEKQLRKVKSQIHVYGHSHVNIDKTIDGVRYINTALAYPYEKGISHRMLKQLL